MAIGYIKRLAGPYIGDGTGQKTFSFGFFVFTEGDVYVATAATENGASSTLQQGTDYTVTLNADQEASPGGTITLTAEAGLADGAVLVIGSDVDYTQTLDLTNYTRFPPERITEELDRIVVQIQQLAEIAERVLTVPPTSSSTPEDLIERLLAAQQEAQQYAQAAEQSAADAEASRDEAAEILEGVKDAAENAEAILPHADALETVAADIDKVSAVGGSITNVDIVAGDLDSTFQPIDVDYGDYDT
ncbi:MAG: hypothetical protein Q3X95_03445, partial [Duodenibacillus sp.]|nr:hypothetical protein [Duodenibacillus sp.]